MNSEMKRGMLSLSSFHTWVAGGQRVNYVPGATLGTLTASKKGHYHHHTIIIIIHT